MNGILNSFIFSFLLKAVCFLFAIGVALGLFDKEKHQGTEK